MREYVSTSTCRLEFLRRQLDDPYAQACGRCDSCAGAWLDAEVPAAMLATAQAHLSRPGVEIEPRRLWPTGAATLGVDVSGKISPADAAEPGRALGRLSDLGWGSRLRELVQPGASDVDVPEDVFRAVVQVLASWEWERRPVAVAAIASRTRPRLVGSLARRLAQVGRLEFLGELDRVGGAAPGAGAASNSVQRLAGVHDAFVLPPALATALPGLAGPVLLVDDLVDSGWTMTVAARLLRQAGAPAVLPFALALQA
jgi:ATP-dependent DNA helicase RecQ